MSIKQNKHKILQAFIIDLPLMQASFPSIDEGVLSTNQWISSLAFIDKQITFGENFQVFPVEKVQMCGIFGNGLIAIGGSIVEKNSNVIKIENNSWYWGNAYKDDYLSSGKSFLTESYSFF
jgi:hypothetical protein